MKVKTRAERRAEKEPQQVRESPRCEAGGQWIGLFRAYGARVRIVYVETDEPGLRHGNRRRAGRVPDPVIDRMISRWEIPDRTEAHEIAVVLR